MATQKNLNKLSMGMSSDFKDAILFGATHIRVGEAIMGIEVNNTKAEIALITNNSGLADLLEESFLMYGKFSISLYSNSSISNLIKK